MGHNSADYLHTIIEAMKLTYADRDSYYADPDFVKVPARGLLSKDYAKLRAQQIDMTRASTRLVAGDPLPFDPEVEDVALLDRGARIASDAAPAGSAPGQRRSRRTRPTSPSSTATATCSTARRAAAGSPAR